MLSHRCVGKIDFRCEDLTLDCQDQSCSRFRAVLADISFKASPSDGGGDSTNHHYFDLHLHRASRCIRSSPNYSKITSNTQPLTDTVRSRPTFPSSLSHLTSVPTETSRKTSPGADSTPAEPSFVEGRNSSNTTPTRGHTARTAESSSNAVHHHTSRRPRNASETASCLRSGISRIQARKRAQNDRQILLEICPSQQVHGASSSDEHRTRDAKKLLEERGDREEQPRYHSVSSSPGNGPPLQLHRNIRPPAPPPSTLERCTKSFQSQDWHINSAPSYYASRVLCLCPLSLPMPRTQHRPPNHRCPCHVHPWRQLSPFPSREAVGLPHSLSPRPPAPETSLRKRHR